MFLVRDDRLSSVPTERLWRSFEFPIGRLTIFLVSLVIDARQRFSGLRNKRFVSVCPSRLHPSRRTCTIVQVVTSSLSRIRAVQLANRLSLALNCEIRTEHRSR